MCHNREKQRYRIGKYIFFNYIISWGLLAVVIGAGAIFQLRSILSGNSPFLDFVRIVYCWIPTITFILFCKKLNINTTIKDFYLQEFKAKIRLNIVLHILLLQILISIAAGCMSAVICDVSIMSVFSIPNEGVAASAFSCLITGASGEETGWRGFLLKGYRQRYNLLVSCIYTGIVWAFWHLPLWILSGYRGINLFIYIVEFIISLVGFTVAMSYYYHKNPNLLICVIFHYMINFLLSFYCGNDILYQGLTACMYVLVSIYLVIKNKDLYLNDI